MALSDDMICSDIMTAFEPGGKTDKIPVTVVMDFLTSKYPNIKTTEKRGRLFQKAFKNIGHQIRRMRPGSRGKMKPICYYYVRMIHTVPATPEELERETQPNSEPMCQRVELSEELHKENELDKEKLRRLEAEANANLLEIRLAEQQKQHLADKTGIMNVVNSLKMELKMEHLRNETAEKELQHSVARLDLERDVRWKAVQDLTKVKPQTHKYVPELDCGHTSNLNKTLGTGIFGRVKLHQYQEQKIAVKDFSLNPRGVSKATLETCVIREANMMLSFKPHPNIVNVLGVIKTDDNLTDINSPGMLLAIEYVHGRSLWTLIKSAKSDARKRGLPWKMILKETADGINALHSMNIIHNDLKEDNIMIRHDNKRPVIIDFGKATFIDKPRWSKYKLKTKDELQEWRDDYPWIAPELLEDRVLPSESTDAFSYGFICHSVCDMTRYQDETLKKVWENLYRCEPRESLPTTFSWFD
ncbi:uncharacterized protein [Amphiura filiformis]|uniref:uncharacterized protein isoform X2 n=1 Tax=Amphiura filiformis TaxID=82378 RepID=UPI003B21C025